MADIIEILDTISQKLSQLDSLRFVPILYDEAELSPNSTTFPCIQLQPMAWERGNDCSYIRELQVRILTNSESKRDAIIELYSYENIVRKAIDEIMNDIGDFDMNLIGGTQIGVLKYVKTDEDSYKAGKKNFASIVAIRYLLRY